MRPCGGIARYGWWVARATSEIRGPVGWARPIILSHISQRYVAVPTLHRVLLVPAGGVLEGEGEGEQAVFGVGAAIELDEVGGRRR